MASSAEYFSRNLRRLREELKQKEEGFSQSGLADRMGVHPNYIGMLERNERKPTLDTLDDTAAGLGVEPYELIMPPEESAGS